MRVGIAIDDHAAWPPADDLAVAYHYRPIGLIASGNGLPTHPLGCVDELLVKSGGLAPALRLGKRDAQAGREQLCPRADP